MEATEQAVQIAAKRHEAALLAEQAKLIDLQTLLDSREEVSHPHQQLLFSIT